jgi:hypothetical protein
MAKLNLNDLVNLQNETSVVSTINNNNQLIEQAIELTLTRTGTSPNAMETDLDMNSNRILNLPLPVSDAEPVRKGEFDQLVEDTVGVVEAAQQARDEAVAAKEAAESAKAGAELAETNAEAAQLAAENAQAAAELAQTNAETAETNAENAQSAAEAAQLAAENAKAAAELAQTNAETAETNAETAEANAEAAQLAAENAQAAAEAARDDAIQAAAEAENAADNFDDVYLGSKPSDPTVDNDGDPLVEGQLYWNNVGNNLRIYDGASWQAYSAAAGMTALVDDANPSLGGNLDLNSNDITGTGDIAITGSVTATTINQGANNVLDDSDIGVTVQAYDATILTSSDIGSTIQAYSANLDGWSSEDPDDYSTTSEVSSAISSATSGMLVAADIGVTVQPYNPDILTTDDIGTAGEKIPRLDATNTWSGVQTFTEVNIGSGGTTLTEPVAGTLAVEGTPLNGVNVLTDGANPALDASLGKVHRLVAAGNRTIAAPTNPTAGQQIIIEHTASGGDRTLALDTGTGGFRFGTDITALTQTASGKTDYIGCIYNATANKWDVVAYAKGF